MELTTDCSSFGSTEPFHLLLTPQSVIPRYNNMFYRKQLFSVLAASTVCAVSSQAALIGFWELDETSGTTALDSSGNGANGSHVNGPSIAQTTVDPSLGTAYRFNGANQEINLGATFNGLTSDFTVSAWINPDDTSGVQRVFSSSTGPGWGFGLNGANLRFTTFGILDYNLTLGSPIVAGEWTHLAVTFDSSFDAEFFVNGVSQGTLAGSSAANAGTGVYRIGSRNGENFDGFIDEVRLYNEVLSDAEVSSLAVVPEPSSAVLLGLGGFALALRRRR